MNGTVSHSSFVDRVLVNLVYVFALPELCAAPSLGRLSTQRAYDVAYRMLGSRVGLPWLSGPANHWSHFWSSYLASTKAVKRGELSSARAWEYVVPHELLPQTSLRLPHEGSAFARTIAYPTAAVVIVEVELTGAIPFAELAGRLAVVRRSNEWGIESGPATRTVDGLIADLADRLYGTLIAGVGEPNGELPTNATKSVYSVAAPAHGMLAEEDLTLSSSASPDPEALSSPTAKTVASMAALSETGVFDPAKLLGSSTAGPTLCYMTSRGHSLWNPTLLDGSEPLDTKDRIGCLVRNHAELVAHVEALASVVRWGAQRVSDGRGYTEEQARLVGPAIRRLRALESGDSKKTYRSEVAVRRLAGLQQELAVAAQAV